MATGLLKLRGVNGKAGWRYLFLIEGGLTLLVGIISFFMMPPGPTQTKAWYRPKGWFNERCVYYSHAGDIVSQVFQGGNHHGQQVGSRMTLKEGETVR